MRQASRGVYNAYSALGIPVNPEEIDALEIGTKARVGGVNLAASAYAYKYDDLQVQSHMTLNGVIVQTLANAANAEMLGVEFTADGRLTERLSFSAGVNVLPTAEYKDFTTASVVVPCPTCTSPIIGQAVSPYDASGSRLVKAPDWTGNLRLTYTAPVMGGEFIGTISDAYKAMLNHVTKELGKLLGKDGIRVNAVSPGPTLFPAGHGKSWSPRIPSTGPITSSRASRWAGSPNRKRRPTSWRSWPARVQASSMPLSS